MIKTKGFDISDEAQDEITKCIQAWYFDACVSDTKKPLFLDADGDTIVKVIGYEIGVVYEVEE